MKRWLSSRSPKGELNELDLHFLLVFFNNLSRIISSTSYSLFPFNTSFAGGSVVKNPPTNVGDVGSIPGSGRSPGERNGKPFQYSCLENPMN